MRVAHDGWLAPWRAWWRFRDAPRVLSRHTPYSHDAPLPAVGAIVVDRLRRRYVVTEHARDRKGRTLALGVRELGSAPLPPPSPTPLPSDCRAMAAGVGVDGGGRRFVEVNFVGRPGAVVLEAGVTYQDVEAIRDQWSYAQLAPEHTA